jgi:hypothetical protein
MEASSVVSPEGVAGVPDYYPGRQSGQGERVRSGSSAAGQTKRWAPRATLLLSGAVAVVLWLGLARLIWSLLR